MRKTKSEPLCPVCFTALALHGGQACPQPARCERALLRSTIAAQASAVKELQDVVTAIVQANTPERVQ